MPDPFDGYQYLLHLRSRWRVGATILTVALATSLVVSLLMPRKYTARVSLVIEPPAGSDPRAATAVSPIYLESLKTYEHFASSDHLFAQAVGRFQLRSGWWSQSMEGLKRALLQVSIPRNTKILEIAVTLPDPRKAHAVATYVAEETIKLNRKTNRAGDDELIEAARIEAEGAARQLAAVDAARLRARKSAPTLETLKADLEQLRGMREEVGRLALSAELSIAEQGDREKSLASSAEGRPADLADASTRLRAARSRAEQLRRQAADLDRQIASRQEALASRTAEIESLGAQYEDAWEVHDELEKRLRQVEGTAGYRGERLNPLDPGVAPEQPSSPNIPLNLLVAAALSLIVSLFYLTLEFSLQPQKAESLRRALRVAAKS